jgi:P27 family predicted phage terminase small subunit
LKRAAGNPGRRELNANEPIPPAGDVVAPPWLDEQARRVWDHVAPVLISMKTLTVADVFPFARYCEMQARYWELRRELMTKGPRGATYMIPGPDGKPRYQTERAEMIEFRRLPSELLKLEDRFGMSAAARSRINVQAVLGPAPETTLGLAGGSDAGPLPPAPRRRFDLFTGGGKQRPPA